MSRLGRPAAGGRGRSLPASLVDLRYAVSWHRRLLAAGLAAAAVAVGLSAVRPAPPETVGVLAAAHDLAAGSALAAADLRTLQLPIGAVPDGALEPGAAVGGRLLAGAVRSGEALTDVRLLGPALLAVLSTTAGTELVATPVRLADPGAATLLQPGDRVDVLAAASSPLVPGVLSDPEPSVADPTRAATTADLSGEPAPGGATAATGQPAPARVLAHDVGVLSVPGTGDGLSDGALVVLATDSPTAARLAAAAITDRLSVTVRGAER